MKSWNYASNGLFCVNLKKFAKQHFSKILAVRH